MAKKTKISRTGYKKDSPHVKEKKLKIPSGDITMKGVEFPVYGQDEFGNGQMMYPGLDYKFPGNMVTEIPINQTGGPTATSGPRNHQPETRKGTRPNPDGSVSSHLMRREYVPGEGWVAFPSLFQNEDGTWVDLGEQYGDEWEPIYQEAIKRGEVYSFGEDEQGAIQFADEGSWKQENMRLGGFLKKAHRGARVTGDMSSDKAQGILESGSVLGYPLTDPQVDRFMNIAGIDINSPEWEDWAINYGYLDEPVIRDEEAGDDSGFLHAGDEDIQFVKQGGKIKNMNNNFWDKLQFGGTPNTRNNPSLLSFLAKVEEYKRGGECFECGGGVHKFQTGGGPNSENVPTENVPAEEIKYHSDYMDQYISEFDRLEGEKVRIQGVKDSIPGEAHRIAGLDSPRTALDPNLANWVENNGWACNTYACQVMRNSGATIPEDSDPITIGGKTYMPGDKLPVIPGNGSFNSSYQDLGFELLPAGTIPDQAGDFIRGHMDDPMAGSSGSYHAVLSEGLDSQGGLKVAYSPGGINQYGEFSQEGSDWATKGQYAQGSGNRVMRYVGNVPAYEKQLAETKALMDRAPMRLMDTPDIQRIDITPNVPDFTLTPEYKKAQLYKQATDEIENSDMSDRKKRKALEELRDGYTESGNTDQAEEIENKKNKNRRWSGKTAKFVEGGNNGTPFPKDTDDIFEEKRNKFTAWLQQASFDAEVDQAIADDMEAAQLHPGFANGGEQWMQEAKKSMKRRGTEGSLTKIAKAAGHSSPRSYCEAQGWQGKKCGFLKGVLSGQGKMNLGGNMQANLMPFQSGGNVNWATYKKMENQLINDFKTTPPINEEDIQKRLSKALAEYGIDPKSLGTPTGAIDINGVDDNGQPVSAAWSLPTFGTVSKKFGGNLPWHQNVGPVNGTQYTPGRQYTLEDDYQFFQNEEGVNMQGVEFSGYDSNRKNATLDYSATGYQDINTEVPVIGNPYEQGADYANPWEMSNQGSEFASMQPDQIEIDPMQPNRPQVTNEEDLNRKYFHEQGSIEFDRDKEKEKAYRKSQKKEQWNQISGEDKANIALSGLNFLGDMFGGDERRKRALQLAGKHKYADNLYVSTPQGKSGNRGNYLTNVQGQNYRPDEMGMGSTGFYGNTAQKGGQIGEESFMTEEEIKKFIAGGGQLEYV